MSQNKRHFEGIFRHLSIKSVLNVRKDRKFGKFFVKLGEQINDGKLRDGIVLYPDRWDRGGEGQFGAFARFKDLEKTIDFVKTIHLISMMIGMLVPCLSKP